MDSETWPRRADDSSSPPSQVRRAGRALIAQCPIRPTSAWEMRARCSPARSYRSSAYMFKLMGPVLDRSPRNATDVRVQPPARPDDHGGQGMNMAAWTMPKAEDAGSCSHRMCGLSSIAEDSRYRVTRQGREIRAQGAEGNSRQFILLQSRRSASGRAVRVKIESVPGRN